MLRTPLPLPGVSPPEALHNAVHSAQQDTALAVDVTLVLALQRGSCRNAKACSCAGVIDRAAESVVGGDVHGQILIVV